MFPGPNHPGENHEEQPIGLQRDGVFDLSTEDDQLVSQQGMFRKQLGLASLGYNPIGELLPPLVLHAISPAHKAILLGKTFFPNLIATPFMESLHAVFSISAALCLIGVAASLLRGKRVVYGQERH